MEKVKKYLILIVMSLVFFPFKVQAKDMIILKVDKSNLDIDKEIIVMANLYSETEFNALTATIDYDEGVFEAINNNNFLGSNKNIDLIYNAQEKKIAIINEGESEADTLFKLKLRVKNQVSDATIKLGDITLVSGNNKVYLNKVATNVKLSKDASVLVKNETFKMEKMQSFIVVIEIGMIFLLIEGILINILNLKNKKIFTGVLIVSLVCLTTVLFSLYNINSKEKMALEYENKNSSRY